MAINYVKIAEGTKREIAKIDVKLDKHYEQIKLLEADRKNRVLFLLSTEKITGKSHIDGTDRAKNLEEKSLKSAIVEIVTRKGRATANDVDTEIIRADLKFIDGNNPNVAKIRNMMSQLEKSGVLHKVSPGTYIKAGASDRTVPTTALTSFNYEMARKRKGGGDTVIKGSIEALTKDEAIGLLRVRHHGYRIEQVVLK